MTGIEILNASWMLLHPRVKVLGGATQFARFLAEADHIGRVARDPGHPDRYSFSLETQVYIWRGQRVIVCETRHNRFEVFAA